MPSQWEPYVNRFIAGAEARIARDQLRGQAPDDIPARVAAQALCAMVERHLTIEVIRNGRDMHEAVRQLQSCGSAPCTRAGDRRAGVLRKPGSSRLARARAG